MPDTLPGWQDPPENVREREVHRDEDLLPEEKETSLTFPNDLEHGRIYTEIPTHIKWVLSVDASDILKVRINDEGHVIGCKAEIPKGIFRFQSSPRNSNTHGRMVSYGDQR